MWSGERERGRWAPSDERTVHISFSPIITFPPLFFTFPSRCSDNLTLWTSDQAEEKGDEDGTNLDEAEAQ